MFQRPYRAAKIPGFELCGGGSAQPVCEHKLPYFLHRADSVREAGPQLFFKGIEAVTGLGFSLDEFDFILPHQANGHIDALLSEYLQLPRERIVNDACRWGNLGSAAIWASLNGLILSGKLKRGQRVLVLGLKPPNICTAGLFISTEDGYSCSAVS
ncbi:3-oxoacyl-[acyl-carrier-protein] synthase III C-terminal domain-containing protein [Aliamphritea spongicola]|nr:3-oxoacyl-[acyl-carrier-protein] synthase III C-terminal domain-containing protein [Aliamphritea spongicola]